MLLIHTQQAGSRFLLFMIGDLHLRLKTLSKLGCQPLSLDEEFLLAAEDGLRWAEGENEPSLSKLFTCPQLEPPVTAQY